MVVYFPCRCVALAHCVYTLSLAMSKYCSVFPAGVPLHMPNKSGARCIHTAAQRGHVGVVNAILHKGEHVDVTTNVRLC